MATEPTAVQFGAVPIAGGGLGTQVAAPRMGVSGGTPQSQRTIAANEWYRGGMDASFGGNLPEFLEQAFAPALNAAKQQKVWDGFVKARSGATMEEITAESPWYTKVFGPTDYEMGAQLYTVQKNMAEMETDFMVRMPELRQMPPEQMAAEFNRMAQEQMTGDPYTDALVQKTMMERAGPMMDLHTKQRTAWQQGEQVKMQVNAISAAATAYQQTRKQYAVLGTNAPNDPKAGENMMQLKRTLFDAMQTSRYQTDGSVKEVYFAAIRGMADRGEGYAISSLVDAGLFGTLEAEDAQRLQAYVDTAETRNKNRWSADPAVVEDIARMHAAKAHGMGGEPVLRMAQAISAKYETDTGSSRPYYDADQLGGFAGDGMNSYIRERNRINDQAFQLSLKQADAAAKEAAEARNKDQVTSAFMQGGWGAAVDMGSMERGEAERTAKSVYDQLNANGQTAQATGMLIWNYSTKDGKVVDLISKNLQHDVEVAAAEQVSDGFMQQYGRWLEMYNGKGFRVNADRTVENTDDSAGPATTLAYYGKTINDRMMQFHRQMQGGLQPDLAYRMTWGAAVQDVGGDLRGLDSAETKANVAAVRAQVDKQDAGMLSRWFGSGQRLHPSTKAVMASSAAHYFESLPAELNAEDRARQAVMLAKQNGLEVAGRFGWTNGRGQRSISAYLNDNGEMSGEVMDELIAKQLKDSGAKVDTDTSLTVVRLPDDSNGDPVIHVLAWTPDGVKDATVYGRDMKNAYRRKAEITTEGLRNLRTKPLSEYYQAPGMFDTR